MRTRRVQLKKILGNRNPADVLTKPMSLVAMTENEKLIRVGVEVQARRSRRRWADMEDDDAEGDCDAVKGR